LTHVFYWLSKTLAWVANPSAWGLLLVLAAVVAARRPSLAAALAGLGALQLLAFSSPRAADALQGWLESTAPRTYRPEAHYDAAIVLGGGADRVEEGAEVVAGRGGRKLLYTGALGPADIDRLVRQLRSWGVGDGQIVIEARARNTYENAVESTNLAAAHGWRSLVIVTNALHMPRALACFRRQGLDPDVLPVDDGVGQRRRGWIPSPSALDQSRAVLHEVIGRIVYRVVGYSL
jgi:uncharacterized SAM-binding protein YcdF (DUF218 family)